MEQETDRKQVSEGNKQDRLSREELVVLRRAFKKRRSLRITMIIVAIGLMLGVTIIAFPSWRLFGMTKLTWAPFFYILMFAIIASNALFWRCPACNGLLGNVFNTRYCSKCGIKFYE